MRVQSFMTRCFRTTISTVTGRNYIHEAGAPLQGEKPHRQIARRIRVAGCLFHSAVSRPDGTLQAQERTGLSVVIYRGGRELPVLALPYSSLIKDEERR